MMDLESILAWSTTNHCGNRESRHSIQGRESPLGITDQIVYLGFKISKSSVKNILIDLSAEPLGLGRHPHPLPVGQTNTIAPGLLVFDEDPYLFLQIVNCFVEFLVDAISQASDGREP